MTKQSSDRVFTQIPELTDFQDGEMTLRENTRTGRDGLSVRGPCLAF